MYFYLNHNTHAAETESLTKRLSATSSTSTSPSPKNQKKVADEKGKLV